MNENDMETLYLVQFKSTIHVMKALSGMIDTPELAGFIQALIDYLDEIIDGKISPPDDILKKFAIAVQFFDEYIELL